MSSDPNLPPDSVTNPAPSPVDPTLPISTQTTAGGLTPNVAAGLSALFTVVGGLIFIILEKRNQFVRFWAMQSIFFGAAWFIFGILSAFIGAILGHILGLFAILWGLLSRLINLGFLVVWIITVVKAFGNQVWEIPVLGQMARAQLSRTP